MLSSISLSVAAKVADQLQDRKLVLDPVEGAPVAFVVSSLGSWANRTELLPNQYHEVMISEASSVGAGMGAESLHDEKMEWAVNLIAKGVSRDLDIAKNIISPSIQRVANDVEEEVSKAFSAAAHGLELVTSKLPKIFMDQKIENLFERYNTIKPGSIQTMLVFPALTPAEIRRRVNTGDDEINGLIAEIADGENFNEVVELYNRYFVKATGMSTFDLTPLGGTSNDALNLMLLYFLTIGLEVDLPDGVNGSITPVTQYLKSLRGHLGAATYRRMRKMLNAIENKELISAVEGTGNDRKIFLNGSVYDRFLDEGGTPEAIYGAVTSNHSFDFAAIVENRGKLERVWERRLDTIHSQNNANKLTLITSAIRKSIFAVINEMDVLPVGAGTKADMINRVRDLTKNFYIADLENLPGSIKSIVLRSLYPEQTNAAFIINGIDKYEGDLGEEEAVAKVAADVTLQLIGEWLVKNVKVGKANG